MKRVLLIASQPYFEWRGSPIRLGYDLLALTQLGYQVDFLTLPLGMRRDLPGVRVIRCPNLFFARRIAIGPSPLKLAFDAVIGLMAVGLVLRHRYAVVHGVEDCGIVAWVCSRLGRAGLIFEKHSDPSSYRGKGLRNMVMSAYAAVERFVMRRADAVIGTGPGLVRQAQAEGRASRTCHIPDIPSSLEAATPAGTAAARSQCSRQPDDVLVTYVGSFAAYQGIDLLFEAIAIAAASEPRARFVIIGGTPAEIAARRAALGDAADAVLFLGFIPPDRVPDYLAASDILLSPRRSGSNTPLKLLDYLKAGSAIVAAECEANRLILNDQLALLTAPDAPAFAAGIAALCADPARRHELGRRGAELVRSQYTFSLFKDGLRRCYEYVLARKAEGTRR